MVAGNEFERGADGEAKSRQKRIPKADAVHIFLTGLNDEFAAGFIAGEESLDNGKVDARRRLDLGWSGSALRVWGGLDKIADKPAPEKPGSDLVDGRIRFLLEDGGNRSEVGFVGEAEMFETLSHAPRARRGLPIELFGGQAGSEGLRGLIIGASGYRQAPI